MRPQNFIEMFKARLDCSYSNTFKYSECLCSFRINTLQTPVTDRKQK